jgi:hypothetical protein
MLLEKEVTRLESMEFQLMVLRSPTSVAKWPEYVFISEGNHLTSRFCRVEVGPTPDSKRWKCFKTEV